MSDAGKRGLAGKILRWLLPLLISGLAIWLVFRQVELSQFIDNLSKIGWRTLFLAVLLYFASLFTRVFCWWLLLRRRVSYWDAFFTMCAGYLLNNVFPFRLGEVGRALLLDSTEGPSALAVFSSVLVERIFDVFLAAVFVLAMLPRILEGAYDPRLIWIAFGLALTGMVVLYLLARFRQTVDGWLARWGERANFIGEWVRPKAAKLLEGLSVLNSPGVFLLSFGALTLSWFLAFEQNLIVFRSLYANPPFWWMIFVLSAAAFGAALPSVPAGLGVFEGVMVASFALLGVGADLAFTHAIVIHVISFAFSSLLGLIGLRMRGQALVSLYQRATQRNAVRQENDSP